MKDKLGDLQISKTTPNKWKKLETSFPLFNTIFYIVRINYFSPKFLGFFALDFSFCISFEPSAPLLCDWTETHLISINLSLVYVNTFLCFSNIIYFKAIIKCLLQKYNIWRFQSVISLKSFSEKWNHIFVAHFLCKSDIWRTQPLMYQCIFGTSSYLFFVCLNWSPPLLQPAEFWGIFCP